MSKNNEDESENDLLWLISGGRITVPPEAREGVEGYWLEYEMRDGTEVMVLTPVRVVPK